MTLYGKRGCVLLAYRGRTVLAIAVATALAASGVTVFALSLAGKTDLLRASGAPEEASGAASPPADGGFNGAELNKLNKALQLIQSRSLYAGHRDKLIDGAIAGMVSALDDPYSVYYPKQDAQQFTDALDDTFSGIGAKLDARGGALVVVRVMSGTPAERAGLQAGDTLLSVNGQSLEGLTLAEATDKIRGPKGTKAKLRVKRAGAADPIELQLVRDRIEAETVSGELSAGGVGLLRIAQFTFETPALAAQRLSELESQGMKSLVLDLRDNPGGVLSAAEAIAELFVPSGRTIEIDEDGQGRKQAKMASGDPREVKSYPVVVLINGGSASSAEILAGALKQSAGATLVGSRTYGKGTVQISFDEELGDGSLLKLTVMKWLLPDGTSVQGKGLAPDVSIDQPDYASAKPLPRDRKLSLDDNGEDVRNLQLMLAGVGCPADRKDGYFSEGTEAAVKKFQQGMKLPETGIVDDATADKLESALYEVLTNPDNDLQWETARERALLLSNGG